MMTRISRYVLYDIAKNKVMVAYSLFLLVMSISFFQMEENGSKAVLSLLNIVLIVIPLVSLVFSTIHWYNSYEFIELMLSQPLSRRKILLSEYAGVCSSMLVAVFTGIGIPVLLYKFDSVGFSLLLIACLLSLVFTSIAFWASVKSRDKARGIGIALLLWFYFALIFDGLVLLIIFTFGDYPLEKFTLIFSSFNPIDLGRIFIMLHLDVGALMGYTGALYKEFFGTMTGMFYTLGILVAWIIFPILFAMKSFHKKDL